MHSLMEYPKADIIRGKKKTLKEVKYKSCLWEGGRIDSHISTECIKAKWKERVQIYHPLLLLPLSFLLHWWNFCPMPQIDKSVNISRLIISQLRCVCAFYQLKATTTTRTTTTKKRKPLFLYYDISIYSSDPIFICFTFSFVSFTLSSCFIFIYENHSGLPRFPSEAVFPLQQFW